MDDVIGSVTGTATYDKLVITSADQGELFEVTGYYEDSATTYRTARLRIGGLAVDGQIDGELLVEPTDDTDTVWIDADENVLSVQQDRPEDDE